jgi:hypothetical protein
MPGLDLIHDASYSECEACGELWDAANHALLAAQHRRSTGHATLTHTEKTVRHGAAPELVGQEPMFDVRKVA